MVNFLTITVGLICANIALAGKYQWHQGENDLFNYEAISNYVNNFEGATWKSGSQKRFRTLADVKKVLGVVKKENAPKLPILRRELTKEDIDSLPTNFDAREHWPNCHSVIGHVRDQSACGSCWSFGAVSAMSDRLCIAGYKNPVLSAADLLSCCSNCGDGCQGGMPNLAWQYWVTNGIVTGGDYESNEGCLPYPFPPCDHHVNGTHGPCKDPDYPTPDCTKQCTTKGYQYQASKIKGKIAYTIFQDQKQIMYEMLNFGSVEADFTVYEDFVTYKSGVYQYVSGEEIGGHAIRMIGWGVEDGVPYWLCVNSWNPEWGDHGLFKILRGEDHCGIEEDINAGTPFSPLF